MLDPGFYLMDCMDALKDFPDKFFDLAIVDPPYGISIASHANGALVGGEDRPFGGKKRANVYGASEKRAAKQRFYHTFDDSRPPDEGYFKELGRVAKRRIIWGGNFMLDYLGNASCMIIWDKKRRNLDQADCEVAWTDLPGQSRVFEYLWNGMLQENMADKEERIHPTQKPVALYSWILSKWAKPEDKILDTHVGSASSLIACRRAGLDFWGFEIDPVFYEQAKKRLDAELAQVSIIDILGKNLQGGENNGPDKR